MIKGCKSPRTKFTSFDAADFLTSGDDAAAYLSAAAEGNDAAHFARALGTVARARNMSALARDTGLTRMGLHKALSGDGNPSLDTAMRVLAALGLTLAASPASQKKPRRAARRTSALR